MQVKNREMRKRLAKESAALDIQIKKVEKLIDALKKNEEDIKSVWPINPVIVETFGIKLNA